MPFNLKVIFTGLCTFVEHADGKRAKVLLIDGRNKLSDHPDLIHCCPVIRFNRADLEPAGLRQADICRDGVRLAFHDSVCFLDGEDLEIKTERPRDAPAPPSLSILKGRRNGDDPEPTDDTRGDWSWVADLGRIRSGAGVPQEWWFAQPPKPPSHDLARPPILARFDLDRGTLSTMEFFRPSAAPDTPSIFTFGSGYKQAIASFVQCDIVCEDNTPVQISSTLFGGQTGKTLTFAPRSKDLIIEVSNAPFYDLMQEFFAGQSHPWNLVEEFPSSFQHFYQLHPPFDFGEAPDRDNRSVSTKPLANYLMIEKGVGCSPSKTDSFAFA